MRRVGLALILAALVLVVLWAVWRPRTGDSPPEDPRARAPREPSASLRAAPAPAPTAGNVQPSPVPSGPDPAAAPIGRVEVVVRDKRDGTPIGGAVVEVRAGDRGHFRRWHDGKLVASAISGPAGSATLEVPLPFGGWLSARPDPSSNLWETPDLKLTREETEKRVEIRMDLATTIRVSGTVRDEEGRSVGGARVVLSWQYIDDEIRIGKEMNAVGWGTGVGTETGPDGRFAFPHFDTRRVWPGSRPSLMVPLGERAGGGAELALVPGATSLETDVVVRRPPEPVARLPVEVRDDAGKPVADAEVVARVTEATARGSNIRNGKAKTSGDGLALVPLPIEGKLTDVRARASGHVPSESYFLDRDIQIRRGSEPQRVSLTLPRTRTCRFPFRLDPPRDGKIEWSAHGQPLGRDGKVRDSPLDFAPWDSGNGSVAELGLDPRARYEVTIEVEGYEKGVISDHAPGSEVVQTLLRAIPHPPPPPHLARVRIEGGDDRDIGWGALCVSEVAEKGTDLGACRQIPIGSRTIEVEPFEEEGRPPVEEYWFVVLVPGYRRTEKRIPVPPADQRPVEVVLRIEPR